MSTTERPTVDAILADTKAHGFEFYTDKVQQKDSAWNVPLVRHLDLDKIVATFGPRAILDSMDGTSRHVTNQRIARDIKADNATAKDVEIQRAIVENWLGMKSRKRTVIETPVYEWNGVKYPSAELRNADAKRDLVSQGFGEDMADLFIARLAGSAPVEQK